MSDTDNHAPDGASSAEDASLQGGSYEVIHGRLREQGKALTSRIDGLNEQRHQVFGGTELDVIANERVRTENNCVPRDIVNIGGRLLFGYNVFIGLKKETSIADVFSLYRFEEKDGSFDLSEIQREEGAPFLTDTTFVKEFTDLYKYYRDTRLIQLRVTDTRVLAVFQIGATLEEIKVFRWRIEPGGSMTYMDSRGEEDHVFPAAHDFEWKPTTRDDQVQGRYPHLSILDQVFIETTDGDLTVKVENNTETGQGIYAEPVDDPNQALDDGQFEYAKVGPLLLIRVLPFREQQWRYLVFNTRTQKVTRIDAIGQACQQLPEDHGIVFPGGYYLTTDDHKVFDADTQGLRMKRVLKSPNGEDVLYVFHRPEEGRYLLMPYNLIRKAVQTPISCHGFSLFEDGRMLVFRALSDEPTRVHPMQVWQTPFTSAEFAANAPTDGSFLAKVGNADLVRGISDSYSVSRLVNRTEPTRQTYEDLIETAGRLLDAYYWIDHEEVGLGEPVRQLRQTAELIVDEFEKVQAMRARAAESLREARGQQEQLITRLATDQLSSVDAFMDVLTSLRHQRGHLISMREIRYVDLGAIDELERSVVEQFDGTSRSCVTFLLREDALRPLTSELDSILERAADMDRVTDITPMVEELDRVNEGLEVISEVVASLDVDDATARTRVLEGISEVYSHLNRARATVQARHRELMGKEGRAEFGAQFKLLGQAISSALNLADTPEKCDEQLSRLMVQLEELEARFSDFDEFLADIAAKREEVYDAVSTKKQALLDERQRRAQNLFSAAERILKGVTRRAGTFAEQDDLNAYFASDAMILKLRQITEQLNKLGDTVKAGEVEARLKSARQDALRGLRDKIDLYEAGDLIKLGRHRFSVNTQPLELTMLPREEGMALHLTGTDFYEVIADPEFEKTRPYWDQQYVSETPDVYRSEYLATSLLFDAETNENNLDMVGLHEAARADGGLLELVRARAAQRYDEGYERGVHDADAALILEKLITLRDSAGLLRFPPTPRAYACLFYARFADHETKASLHRRARSLGRLQDAFGHSPELERFTSELSNAIVAFLSGAGIECTDGEARLAGSYLAEELRAEHPRFVTSTEADTLRQALMRHMDMSGAMRAFEEDLRSLGDDLRTSLSLVRAWVRAFVAHTEDTELSALGHATTETAVLMLTTDELDRDVTRALTRTQAGGLLGQHPRITSGSMDLRFDEVLERMSAYRHHHEPGFRAYREVRHSLIERERERLRLEQYKPKVMSAFVRNQLINDVYLPLIGDNLAKQLGAAGDSKRTDLMGLLLLVSPPGYGKTTLMEYVANRLGLIFMKINGPALGHGVHSLDPAEAPNATARQEVEKINLAFEMGNNVMLYLDDIQHTHSELLQKFISLCDAQRRVEGVWKGRTLSYDLRGKRFCVVMAGNPYTESGEKFQIPDMLANRADTYNLGDILAGKDEAFALSYVENAITSNAALAPLAARDPRDVYQLIRMTRGEEVATSELSYGYSSAELAEMKAVLERLFSVRDVLLRVNMQYIESASQEDAYRTEPPFKLQGSYRNMNKLAEKVVSAMNDEELEHLLDDHYQSESQTLTTGAEHNLLKLAELRGRVTAEQADRWKQIKSEFVRVKSQGGGDDDPVTRVTGTLGSLGKELESIRETIGQAAERGAEIEASRLAAETAAPTTTELSADALVPYLEKLERALFAVANPKLEVTVQSQPPTGVSELLAQQVSIVERTLIPLVRTATKNLDDAHSLNEHVIQLLDLIRKVDARLRGETAD